MRPWHYGLIAVLLTLLIIAGIGRLFLPLEPAAWSAIRPGMSEREVVMHLEGHHDPMDAESHRQWLETPDIIYTWGVPQDVYGNVQYLHIVYDVAGDQGAVRTVISVERSARYSWPLCDIGAWKFWE